MTTLLERLVNDFRDSLDVRSFGSSDRVTLPYPLHDQSLVAFYITDNDGRVSITDHGVIAANLELSGVHLDPAKIRPSWHAIIEATGFAPAMYEDDLEVRAECAPEELPAAIRELTAAALRVDSLRRPPTRKKTWRDEVSDVFLDFGNRLKVIPNASIPISGGSSRHVALSVSSTRDDADPSYVITMNTADRGSAWDRARAVFGDADEVDLSRKIAALQGSSAIWAERFPLDKLRKHATVADHQRLEVIAASLAA